MKQSTLIPSTNMHATILLSALLMTLTTTSAFTSTITSFTNAITLTTTLPRSSPTVFGCTPMEGTNSCCYGAWVNGTYSGEPQSKDFNNESSSTITLPTGTLSRQAPITIIATGKEPWSIIEPWHCVGTVYVIQTEAASTTTKSLTSSFKSNGAARATAMPEKAWEVLAVAAVAAAGAIV